MAFDLKRLTKLPVLISAGLAVLGWVLALLGALVAGAGSLVGFYIFYLLLVILGVIGLIAYDNVKENRVAIVAFVAIGFNFIVSLCSVATYANGYFGLGCLSAGGIFLSIPFLYWIVLLGSGESAFDGVGTGFSLPSIQLPKVTITMPTKAAAPAPQPQQPPVAPQAYAAPQQQVYAASQAYTAAPPPQPYTAAPPPQQTFQPAPSPQVAVPTQNYTAPEKSSPVPAPVARDIVVVPEIYKAQALYNYTANPSDPNELSFNKGQVLDIVDKEGKWWKARYVDASGAVVTGVVPSNYVTLI
ncbi:hypothetical protein BCR33DRAFT_685709 [Rhizoclosmatium globosum]|uniref:SH3 domain-containing protein n=1 Tax=Rhizoclosmatium globosum TaxID=329046 RepID=A0A1Y2B5Q8_9FUNG|nr:hypothetical protein BCR33DRAFT_685709 [Rhizoclosmatium globosum]|eukprot:ORY29435.1 hypothetical protein BCR33DRAFT_685709 [Rhizoclosmatium globosum]